jgi:hypothetical protein
MAVDDTQKILESIQKLEQRMEKSFSEVREEMQGGFALTHQRIAQSEESIKNVLDSMIELHDSLDKRVKKLENKVDTSHSH